jgi:hypothetical protein
MDVTKRAALESLDVELLFNDPLPVDENEKITNLIASFSAGLLSRETAVMQHPYIKDGTEEVTLINKDTTDANNMGLTV